MIRLSGVSFSYQGSEKLILKDINFAVNEGECVLLSGKSGCGKSTLLMLINGIIPEYLEGKLEGDIFVDGQEVRKNTIQKMAESVGSVFQNPKSQFFHIDTTDEVLFACSNQGTSKEKMRERLAETTELFGIEKLLNRSVFKLSGGEKQKLACASVYTGNPAIFVFDEPSANLDQEAIQELSDIIRKIKAQGHTILIAEHRLYYLMDLCDRVVYMEGGSIHSDYAIDKFKEMKEEERIEKGLRSFCYVDIMRPPIQKSEAEIGIQIKNLEFRKENQKILSIPDLSIQEGNIVAVVGKNGAGKSTFAKCLCGLYKCKGIYIEEMELKEKKRNKIFDLVMQDVNHQLFSESVLDEFFVTYKKKDFEKLAEVEELLKKIDLAELAETHPMALSGGQKQRLAVGISVFQKKKYIIFDEPTSGLDYQHMVSVAKLIRELKKFTKIIFVITHDYEFLNLCCDGYIELKDGSLAYT